MCMPTDRRPKVHHAASQQLSFRRYRGGIPNATPFLDERQAFWIFIKLFFFLLQQNSNNIEMNNENCQQRPIDVCRIARILVTECAHQNRMGPSENNDDQSRRRSDLPTQVACLLRWLVGESYWIYSRNYFERYCVRRGIRHAPVTALYQDIHCNN